VSDKRSLAVKALALSLPEDAWQTIAWREGADDALTSRFARVRVRPAHRDYNLTEPRPEDWLLIEWPEGEDEPLKYWLSTVAADIGFDKLVDIGKLRSERFPAPASAGAGSARGQASSAASAH